MAFTKAPMADSHNVQRILPPLQPILTSSTTTVSATAAYIDCFPLKEEQWQGQPIIGIHKREGWGSTTATGTTLTGTYAGYSVAQSTNVNYPKVFYTFGAGLYMFDYSTNVNSLISNTATGNYRGTLTNAINSTNTRKIVCLEGGGTPYLTMCDEDGTNVTTTSLAAIGVDGVKGLVYINGYLFAVNTLGNKIYNSNAGGVLTTWTSTDFLDAEQYADPIMYIEKHHNYLVAFGTSSIEFFYDNAVEIGSPLARQESYSTQVGILLGNGGNFTTNGRLVAKHADDLYFLGCSPTVVGSLYRIRNFKVEEINTPSYIKGILNSSSYGSIILHSNWINNNPCVVVELLNSGGTYAYMVEEDCWFKINGADYPQTATGIVGVPFVTQNTIGTGVPGVYALTGSNGAYPKKWQHDATVSVTAIINHPIQDLGVNRWKALHRVDLVGDYGTNTVSLTMGKSMNYESGGSISCGSQTQSTIGYEANMSWYKIGSFRQFWPSISISGTAPAIHRAVEVEYDVGAS